MTKHKHEWIFDQHFEKDNGNHYFIYHCEIYGEIKQKLIDKYDSSHMDVDDG